MLKKEYRDEKAVKNAVKELSEGKFKLYFPGDEGYEDSLVDVREIDAAQPVQEIENITAEEDDDLDNEDIAELMNADEVFDSEAGFTIEDGEEE